jgi:hypothetical protein
MNAEVKIFAIRTNEPDENPMPEGLSEEEWKQEMARRFVADSRQYYGSEVARRAANRERTPANGYNRHGDYIGG